MLVSDRPADLEMWQRTVMVLDTPDEHGGSIGIPKRLRASSRASISRRPEMLPLAM
jgi:hypothetical protein